ncbi:uncharacterized protein LOC141716932 isoform X3 [Apium graveolens]|uniref:uncharacterized protein LOC141716932 isoform X3 n=1 Tax=Apium graveolens TaxID=4045 RepID=UPI003D7A7745
MFLHRRHILRNLFLPTSTFKFSYVAGMYSDRSDGESEEELEEDVNYTSYEEMKLPTGSITEYATLGPLNVRCSKCEAWMWKEECVNKSVTRGISIFPCVVQKVKSNYPKRNKLLLSFGSYVMIKHTLIDLAMVCVCIIVSLHSHPLMGRLIIQSITGGGGLTSID